jgi:hypothetical protein
VRTTLKNGVVVERRGAVFPVGSPEFYQRGPCFLTLTPEE